MKADAERGIDGFVAEFEAKYLKAAVCLAEDREALLAFFGFPAEHWLHLRTSNVIESVFATVRLRQRVTKGASSRTRGLLKVYKLVVMAQRRWRRLNGRTCCPWSGPAWSSSMASSRRRERIGRRLPDHVKGRSTTLDNSSRGPRRGGLGTGGVVLRATRRSPGSAVCELPVVVDGSELREVQRHRRRDSAPVFWPGERERGCRRPPAIAEPPRRMQAARWAGERGDSVLRSN